MVQRTTTAGQIVSFWRARANPPHIQIEWSQAHRRCWRCAAERSKLERCHIVPASLGGEDVPSNYVLLCAQCHLEAPDVPDPNAMWEWIRDFHDDSPIAGFHWQWQRMKAALEIIGPFDETAFSLSLFKDAISKTEVHQGRLSPSTIAWAMKQAITEPV